MRIEETILSNLIHNEGYCRKVIPFIVDQYFHDSTEKKIFQLVEKFISNYNNLPTKETLLIEIENDSSINEELYKNISQYVSALDFNENTDQRWLVENTEKFCQEKAVYNAIMESISIIDGNNKAKDRGAIPEILSEALGVSFNDYIGHDFLENANERYEYYTRKLEKLPFDIEFLNTITGGGLDNKTLNMLIAGTNVGKTLVMCHLAAAHLVMGKNVLYITLEMAEEKIAQRIDANLLNVPMGELENFPKDYFDNKINALKKKTGGKLIIKEYPTASAGASHFRYLMNELNLKKDFRPDIVYIDYINLCLSSRLKMGSNVNSYSYVKAIAEELRGLAVEKNIPILSATQLNRTGFTNSDPGMEDTAESWGLPQTVDLLLALINSEQLEELNQIQFKQLKSRYGDPTKNRRFVVGIDRLKMRLYDVEQEAQDVVDDGPAFDKTPFGKRLGSDEDGNWRPVNKTKKKDFSKLFGGRNE